MINDKEFDDLRQKLLCFHCVGDSYLQAEIQREGPKDICSYCERVDSTYTIGALAERVEHAFEQHYVRTSDQPSSWELSMLLGREPYFPWERDGEPVVWAIANAAEIPEEAAQDIQSILDEKHGDYDSSALGGETEFCSGSHYEEKPASDETWQAAWTEFERSLKTEARFFSQSAADHLVSLFGGIETMSTIDERPLVINAGPDTSLPTLYRARVFQSDKELVAALRRPDHHLGPPPSHLASAGRMNASGISVFYGANHPQAAISEVRPPIGSQIAVAQFDIIQPMRLLDLTALSTVGERGSIFDPDFAVRTERAVFLRALSTRIAQPIMPNDEAFDYLPTQAIADFLATEFSPQLDGIIFPSAQAGGDALNVVLFHKVARVEAIEVPEGAEIEVGTAQMYEDGWEREYTVVERLPPKPDCDNLAGEEAYPCRPQLAENESTRTQAMDYRVFTLRLNVNSIKVHVINRVDYDTTEHPVTRRQLQVDNLEF